jgi:hypothetical protein
MVEKGAALIYAILAVHGVRGKELGQISGYLRLLSNCLFKARKKKSLAVILARTYTHLYIAQAAIIILQGSLSHSASHVQRERERGRERERERERRREREMNVTVYNPRHKRCCHQD